MPNSLSMLQVDAFTSTPFAGNPAGVCFLDHERDARWMQAAAAEMALSETAFLLPEGDEYRLRWFTPACEVRLCGHATLASAHALWESGRLAGDRQARFRTLSGLLTADRRGEWIELDFPAHPVREADIPGLARALGALPVGTWQEQEDVLVELESETVVRGLTPDLAALAGIPARGVTVTARAVTPGFDFVSRFFAPRVGVPEDPVTGSAHCALTPFWARKLGRDSFTAFQASPRGGILKVRLAGDRVRIAGQAVTVFRADWLAL